MTPEDFKQLRIGDIVGRKIKYISERTGKVRIGRVQFVFLPSAQVVNYTGYSEVIQCREIKEIL